MSKKELYKVYEYTCDLCKRTWTPGEYFADNAAGGFLHMSGDGVNHLELYKWEHLCLGCRISLTKHFKEKVDELSGSCLQEPRNEEDE